MSEAWEYLVIDEGIADLTAMGLDGWELVSVVYRQWENERKGYTDSATTYYCKRRSAPFTGYGASAAVTEPSAASEVAPPNANSSQDLTP